MTETLPQPGRYTMRDTNAVARDAARIITRHLRAHPDTVLSKMSNAIRFISGLTLIWSGAFASNPLASATFGSRSKRIG